ncbi:hypothetical protein ERO13_A10G053766v2 [Gossypium hirsutum]|uniref:Uncharacterized protein n=1 Tax=Gossypium mustelinum TaxID=34275 RepID=A0A5D2XHT1_GOSMU|nr:hypothetical protein ERO13_A10G053766v2 [Gossypium hirsutum]TYJ13547.1 hypothetical protein E1A91_A10G059000v1 [Gossypium mustelinum]
MHGMKLQDFERIRSSRIDLLSTSVWWVNPLTVCFHKQRHTPYNFQHSGSPEETTFPIETMKSRNL